MGYDINPFIEFDERWGPRRELMTSNMAILYVTRDQLLFGLLSNGAVGARIWDGKEQQPFMGVDGTPLPLVFKAEPGKVYRPHAEVNAWLAALRALEGLEQVERARLVFRFCN